MQVSKNKKQKSFSERSIAILIQGVTDSSISVTATLTFLITLYECFPGLDWHGKICVWNCTMRFLYVGSGWRVRQPRNGNGGTGSSSCWFMACETLFGTSMHVCGTVFLTRKNSTLALPLLTICSPAPTGCSFYVGSVIQVWRVATRNWNCSKKKQECSISFLLKSLSLKS